MPCVALRATRVTFWPDSVSTLRGITSRLLQQEPAMVLGAFFSIGWVELAMLMTVGIFLLTLFLVVFSVISRHSRDDQQRNKP